MISHPAAAEAGLQCVSMVVLGWIGCSLSGGCATLWMIRMFTWGRRAATACAGNHSTSARYPVARERERGVRAFKAVVVFHASRRRVLAQRGIPTAHYSHLSLSESWFFVLSDRSTRARSRSRYGRTDGLGVTRAAKQLMRCRFHVSFRKNFAAKRQPTNQPPSWAGWSSAALVDCGANERHAGAARSSSIHWPAATGKETAQRQRRPADETTRRGKACGQSALPTGR